MSKLILPEGLSTTIESANRAQRRGFDRSLWPKIARDEWLKISKVGRSQAIITPPASLMGLFEEHGKSFYPTLLPPAHFSRITDLIDRTFTETVRCVIAAPPQHGKTVTLLMGVLYHCMKQPGRQHLVATYSVGRALPLRKQFEAYARSIGFTVKSNDGLVRLNGGHNVDGGSTIRFTSISAAITGFAIDGIVIVDDPIRNHEDASSATVRENIYQTFLSGILTREGRHGLSVIVCATRWHVDDLSGRLVMQHNWPYLRIPAICDDEQNDPNGRKLGEALWSERGVEALNEQRRNLGEHMFASMFQGLPTPLGERVFELPLRYTNIPTDGIITTYGIDVAGYGKIGRTTDWSVCVRLVTHVATRTSYVDRIIRKQCKPEAFVAEVAGFVAAQPGPVMWSGAGQESEIARGWRATLLPTLTFMTATREKRIRANDVINAWNDNRVMFPVTADPIQTSFLSEILLFTGNSDPHDDCIDALASAYEAIKHRLTTSATQFVTIDSRRDSTFRRLIDSRTQLW